MKKLALNSIIAAIALSESAIILNDNILGGTTYAIR